jgi:hypothetical protein
MNKSVREKSLPWKEKVKEVERRKATLFYDRTRPEGETKGWKVK